MRLFVSDFQWLAEAVLELMSFFKKKLLRIQGGWLDKGGSSISRDLSRQLPGFYDKANDYPQ